MIHLIIASRNSHKSREIQEILAEVMVHSLDAFPGAPELLEDAETFEGNARRKAIQLAEWLRRRQVAEFTPDSAADGWYVLADDSGLEVDALNGAPGVYSARYAARESRAIGNSLDAANNAKLLRALAGVPLQNRTARFRCILALLPLPLAGAGHPPELKQATEVISSIETFEGRCEGHIEFEPKGEGGFGYDPLFIPRGCLESFAELGATVKNQLSHRARAVGQLRRRFFGGDARHRHPDRPADGRSA